MSDQADIIARLEAVDARLEAVEAPRGLLSWTQGPPPPRLTESNRLLAERWQARQAELRAIAEAEEAKVRAEEAEQKRRAHAAHAAAEPQRQRARAEMATAQARLAELNLKTAPVDAEREELREYIREQGKIAES